MHRIHPINFNSSNHSMINSGIVVVSCDVHIIFIGIKIEIINEYAFSFKSF